MYDADFDFEILCKVFDLDDRVVYHLDFRKQLGKLLFHPFRGILSALINNAEQGDGC